MQVQGFGTLKFHGSRYFKYTLQGSQNFKIPGSPSGRYSSDFGSPKVNLTSPNKKKDLYNFLFYIYIYIYIYIERERKSDRSLNQSKIFSIHKYQQI